MTYNPNIPLGNQKGSDSQSDMLKNFQAIKTTFETNHGTFDTANQGKHTKTVLHVQPTVPTTIAGEISLSSLISKESGNSVSELSLRHQSNDINAIFTSGVSSPRGWSRLPSGLLIKWLNDVNFHDIDGTGSEVSLTQPPLGPLFLEVYAAFVTPAHQYVGNFYSYIHSFDTTRINVWTTLRDGGNTAVQSSGNLLIIGK